MEVGVLGEVDRRLAAAPELLRRLPRDRVVVALDARGGEVLSHGWRRGTGASIADRMRELGQRHAAASSVAQVYTAYRAAAGDLFQLTFLKGSRFYTHSALATAPMELVFTETGANDPDFNLRREQALVQRVREAGT